MKQYIKTIGPFVLGGVVLLALFTYIAFTILTEKTAQDVKEEILTEARRGAAPGELYLIDVVKNDRFLITYYEQSDEFTITIQQGPFYESKDAAEVAFLNMVGGDKTISCQLNPKIGAPRYVAPEVAGQIFYLSFCEDAL